jgi:transposase
VRVTAAFSRLLRLDGVWVRAVRFRADRVVVEVALRRRRLVCPECSFSTPHRHNIREVQSGWRHLDLGSWRLEIRATLRRLTCPVHGVRTEGVPFARAGSDCTRDFECLVAWLATRTDKSTICRLVRINWRTVGRIVGRVSADELDPDRLDELFEIGLDEVSWASQHRYLTLVTDHRRRRIVWGAEGHDSTTADRFFAELGKQRCERIEAISLDMGPGYGKSAREHAPQAQVAIDPFHVAKAGSDALDEVRRGYWNQLRQLGDKDAARRFKGARWALLKNPTNLSDAQAATLGWLRAAGGEVWRGYTLKEALRAIFAPGLTPEDVELLIDRFISRAQRSRLEPFVKLAATIRKHRDGILAATRLGVTNARAEALNNKGTADRPTRLRLSLRIRRARADHAQLRTRRPAPPTRTSPTSMTRDPESIASGRRASVSNRMRLTTAWHETHASAGARLAPTTPASAKRQRRHPRYRVPCDSALKRGTGDAGGALLLSPVVAVVRPRAEISVGTDETQEPFAAGSALSLPRERSSGSDERVPTVPWTKSASGERDPLSPRQTRLRSARRSRDTAAAGYWAGDVAGERGDRPGGV